MLSRSFERKTHYCSPRAARIERHFTRPPLLSSQQQQQQQPICLTLLLRLRQYQPLWRRGSLLERDQLLLLVGISARFHRVVDSFDRGISKRNAQFKKEKKKRVSAGANRLRSRVVLWWRRHRASCSQSSTDDDVRRARQAFNHCIRVWASEVHNRQPCLGSRSLRTREKARRKKQSISTNRGR